MLHTVHRIQWLNTVIKALLIAAFLGAISYKLIYTRDFHAIWDSFIAAIDPSRVWLLCIVLILMPVNWLLEARKWKLLMRPALPLSLGTSLRAVLSGVAVSLFTPNRIGEYGGRILFVPSKYNWRAVLATLVGSFGQNLVHVTFGLLALAFFIFGIEALPVQVEKGLVWLMGLTVIALYAIYINLAPLSTWLMEIKPVKWLQRPWRALGHLQAITRADLGYALGFALLRYITFSTQFVLLLVFFDVSVPIPWIAAGVAVMFLMQTSIPLPPFVDVMARSELALILWMSFEVNELAVMSASFFLWIINLLVPAFFGLLALSKVNVLQSLGYEDEPQMALPHPPRNHAVGDGDVVQDR